MSPQSAPTVVASARTEPPLFASQPSARTTGTPSAAPGTTWCAYKIQGSKIESGGG